VFWIPLILVTLPPIDGALARTQSELRRNHEPAATIPAQWQRTRTVTPRTITLRIATFAGAVRANATCRAARLRIIPP
jgi:hypothetical protein